MNNSLEKKIKKFNDTLSYNKNNFLYLFAKLFLRH